MNKTSEFLSTIFKVFLLLGLLFACNSKEEIIIDTFPPSENPEFLRGKWVEKESEEIIAFAGSNHIIEFTEDEFLLTFRYWTDAISPEDDCQNSYTAYFKGVASVEADSITLQGIATNESFEVTPAECDRYATFDETFKYEVVNDETLLLNPNQQVYLQILLEKEN
ncbi:MAG: hypothetical protein AAF960_13155 [Bacteroidota bacterium]